MNIFKVLFRRNNICVENNNVFKWRSVGTLSFLQKFGFYFSILISLRTYIFSIITSKIFN